MMSPISPALSKGFYKAFSALWTQPVQSNKQETAIDIFQSLPSSVMAATVSVAITSPRGDGEREVHRERGREGKLATEMEREKRKRERARNKERGNERELDACKGIERER